MVRFIPTWDEEVTCDDPGANAVNGVIDRLDTGRGTNLYFAAPGLYALCYMFNYMELPQHRRPQSTYYQQFFDIRVGVVEYDKELIAPIGTALNCTTTVTIYGRGFLLAGEENPTKVKHRVELPPTSLCHPCSRALQTVPGYFVIL